ncbi:hypothetical protein [Marinicellulosiphila megalodicopiae]|uniref:hypothetical protein n=1 Tax=Marinicellulosiphila megalodicopiae TaxID=2724896 RepID=UPI003BB0A708
MANTASFKAVKQELENTLTQAQIALEEFSTDLNNLSAIERCIELISQSRGIFVVIEDKGASLLTEEMIHLLNMLPIDGKVDKSALAEQFDAISQAMIILPRYLEYLDANPIDLPLLLIPTINGIRKIRKLSLLKESHFYEYQLKDFKKPASKAFKFTDQTSVQLRSYRQMYQAAFLSVLNGERTKAALKYMSQALLRIDQICADSEIAPMFWVGSIALECMAHSNAQMQFERKIFLIQIDRSIARLIKNGESEFSIEPSRSLVKEMLYLIAIMNEDNANVIQVKSLYQLSEVKYFENQIQQQREMLFSPGKSTTNSLSKAIYEDLEIIKDMINTAARAEGKDFDSKLAAQLMNKIVEVLAIIGLPSPSNVLKQQSVIVDKLDESKAVSSETLNGVADAVLYCETAIARIKSGSQEQYTGMDEKQIAILTLVKEARVVLIDEAESGLSQAKRAISLFVDSQDDKNHLTNVLETLNSVRGALIFLDCIDAANLVAKAMNFVHLKLLEGDQFPASEKLEAFADGISSLEFYLEGLLVEQKPDEKVLAMTTESLNQLEY